MARPPIAGRVLGVLVTLPFDLTTGQAVVILLRLVAPLLIPRRPLLGSVAAMLLDRVDVIVVVRAVERGA